MNFRHNAEITLWATIVLQDDYSHSMVAGGFELTS